MRLPLLLLALITAGCDSADDLQPVDGVVLVSVVGIPNVGTGFQLRTESAYPCGSRLVVTEETRDDRLRVAVDGVSGPGACESADAPLSYTTPLTATGFVVSINVQHRGETDRYEHICGFAGCDLRAVRTSTTRLATP